MEPEVRHRPGTGESDSMEISFSTDLSTDGTSEENFGDESEERSKVELTETSDLFPAELAGQHLPCSGRPAEENFRRQERSLGGERYERESKNAIF